MRRFRWLPVLLTTCLLLLETTLNSPFARATGRYSPREKKSEILNFYVDALAGDDKASCEKTTYACQTLQAALDRIPVVLTQEVTVNVAAGTYSGGAVLMDRLSPQGHAIRLLGEAGMTIMNGYGEQETGIAVSRAPRVFVEGFVVTGFTRAGLSFFRTGSVSIAETHVLSNPGTGIEAREADVVISESVVDDNGGHGILCDGGNVTFRAREGGRGVVVTRNGGNGIHVTDCHALFEGAAVVSLNHSGLVAEHGGEINLAGRTDVIVNSNYGLPGPAGTPPPGDPRGNPVPLSHLALCEMIADNHGLVTGYWNAPLQGDCLCLESHFGVCSAD